MLAAAAQLILVVFLGSLMAIVLFKLLAGSINLVGVLTDKETQAFSPGRLQLLLATFGGAIFYFSQIVNMENPLAMPPVPPELLVIVGGSNLLYLGGKIHSRFFRS